MAESNPLWALVTVFAPLSLASVGGGTATLPAMQHQAVDVQHWLTAREFVDLFAVARLAPGPGSMLVTLIGWKVFGWSGALIATLAMFVPSSLLCYAVTRAWTQYKGKMWHTALEQGLAPIGTGLLAAGVLAMFQLMGMGWPALLVAAAVAAVMMWRPRFQPLIALLCAGALFACGSVIF